MSKKPTAPLNQTAKQKTPLIKLTAPKQKTEKSQNLALNSRDSRPMQKASSKTDLPTTLPSNRRIQTKTSVFVTAYYSLQIAFKPTNPPPPLLSKPWYSLDRIKIPPPNGTLIIPFLWLNQCTKQSTTQHRICISEKLKISCKHNIKSISWVNPDSWYK
jgi:hypothetical protein